MTMSASPSKAFVIFFSLSPGANSQLRIGMVGLIMSFMGVLEAKARPKVKGKPLFRSGGAVVLARIR